MKNLHNINSILKVKSLATDPSGADEAGLIYFNTTTNTFRMFDGTAWGSVTVGGSVDLTPYFKKDGSVSATGAFNLGAFKITNLAEPTANQDAATKNYVDTEIAGIDLSAYLPLAGGNLTGAVTSTSAISIDNGAGDTIVIDPDDALGASITMASGMSSVQVTSSQVRMGAMIINNGSINGLNTPTNGTDAANKDYVDTAAASAQSAAQSYADTQLAGYLPLSGGTMSGAIAMGSNAITGLAEPTAAQDAATMNYVDTAIAGIDLSGYIPLSQKGANNGVATLDAGGKVPVSQLPASVMEYKGTWTASTNTPTLADGTGNAGDIYVASDAGTVNFGAGNITFAAGDWVMYNGAEWQKSVNSNAVASVNGQTGVVTLDTDDISEGSALYFTNARAIGSVLTGYTSGAGTVAATDSILQAIQKLDGNTAAVASSLSGYLKDDATVTIKGTLIPDGDATRNFGSTAATFASGFFTELKASTSSPYVALNTGALYNSSAAATVDWENRKLLQSGFMSASWDSFGLDMYDSANTANRRISGIGSVNYYTGTNMNALVSSNRSFGLATAGTATISTSSSKFYIVNYSAVRNSGGNDSKTGTITIAKESISSNTNASITETSTTTNISMDNLTFSINASGNLEAANATGFTVDIKYHTIQM